MTGTYIRILMASEMGLSCGQRRFGRRLFFCLPRDDARPLQVWQIVPFGNGCAAVPLLNTVRRDAYRKNTDYSRYYAD